MDYWSRAQVVWQSPRRSLWPQQLLLRLGIVAR